GSPRRIELLQQAGIEPDRVLPADIDETPLRSEHPRSLAKRLSREKAEKALMALMREAEYQPGYVLAADTVVALGWRILPKAATVVDALACRQFRLGRAYRVYSGMCVMFRSGQARQGLVVSCVRFKRVSRSEIDGYVLSGRW